MLLARLVFHEHLGRRALAAAALVLAGAHAGRRCRRARSVRRGRARRSWRRRCWRGRATTLVSRTLADRDPLSVVAWKGLLGGVLSAAVARCRRRGAAFAGRGLCPHRYRRRRLRPQPALLPARPGAGRRGADRVGVRGGTVRRVGCRARSGRALAGRRIRRGGGADDRRRVVARLGTAPAPAPSRADAPRARSHARRRSPRASPRPDARRPAQPRARARGASRTSMSTARTCTTGITIIEADPSP